MLEIIQSEAQYIEQSISKFDINAANLELLKQEADGYSISKQEIDEYTKEEYKGVLKMWQKLKNARIAIEKKGKELREFSNNYNKAIIAHEKSLIKIIEEEEARLKMQKDSFEALKEAEKERKEKERLLKIQTRMEALQRFNYVMDISLLEELSDEDFETVKQRAQEDHEAMLKQVEEENQKKKEADTIMAAKLKALEEENKKLKASIPQENIAVPQEEKIQTATFVPTDSKYQAHLLSKMNKQTLVAWKYKLIEAIDWQNPDNIPDKELRKFVVEMQLKLKNYLNQKFQYFISPTHD